MIRQVGYAEDGTVWMMFDAELEGQKGMFNLSIPADNAREAAKSLTEAAAQAERFNVGDSQHADKSGVKDDRGDSHG